MKTLVSLVLKSYSCELTTTHNLDFFKLYYQTQISEDSTQKTPSVIFSFCCVNIKYSQHSLRTEKVLLANGWYFFPLTCGLFISMGQTSKVLNTHLQSFRVLSRLSSISLKLYCVNRANSEFPKPSSYLFFEKCLSDPLSCTTA